MKHKFSKLQDAMQFFGEAKQKNLLMIVGGGALILLISFAFASGDSNSGNFYKSAGVKMTDFTSTSKPEEEWMARSENDLKSINEEVKDLKKLSDKKDREIAELKEALGKIIEEQAQKLEEPVIKSEETEPAEVLNSQNNLYEYSSNLGEDFVSRGGELTGQEAQSENFTEDPTVSRAIESFSFAYAATSRLNYNLDNYLPAGSYARAILLSSVDASVGVESQSDPRPVLFRVISPANTSKYEGDNQEIDINGCTVTGAASGDLSSEKVYIRLLKMTCSDEEGKVIETAVSGYAAAMGKAGIRGPVVSREGDFLMQSFFAGLFGSFGEGVASRFRANTSFADGITSEVQSSEDIAKEGVGAGINDAMDRLADYLIDRAEQYQPVISIPANIEVELVFIDGAYLDGTVPDQQNEEEQQAASSLLGGGNG